MSTMSDLVLRILISAKDDSAPAMNTARERIKSISDQLQQVEKIATRFLSFQIFSGWAQDAARLNDTYNEIQGELSQVVGRGEQLVSVQDRLLKSSQAAGVGLKDSVDLYARSAEALKKLNDGQELSAKLTETVNLSFRAQRTNAVEASSTVTQLTQAIGTGTVTWEDFGNVAQSNLLLVNTAAKNLGYDGVSGLKQAISESKITGEQMARAIVAGFDDIKARAEQMPLGISQSMTLINNAMIKFTGESNQVNAAASAVSKTLQIVADNMNALANAALFAAEVYGMRMVTGFAASSSAALKASLAVKDKAVAEQVAQAATQRSIVLETQLAAVRLKAAQNAVNEARLQLVLADGIKQKKLASDAMAKTMDKLHAAESQYQTAALATRAAVDASAKSATLAGRAVGVLGGAIKALPLIGWALMLADWATKLDIVYVSSMRVQEGIAQIALGLYNLGTFSGIDKMVADARNLHAEYNKIIAENTSGAKQAAAETQAAEQQKAQAIEEAAQKQQAAFKQVQEATKALTAQLDADAKAQTASLQQALTDKLALLEVSNQMDQFVDTQRLQLKLEAAQAETAIAQDTANKKLALIDAEYQKELQAAANNAQRTKEIETEKRQAKLSVYQGLAEYYQGEVARLSQLYAQENQAAAQSRNQLKQLETNYETELFNLKLKGMTDRQKLQAEEAEYRKQIQIVQKEYDKGEAADKGVINRALERAKALHGEITTAAGNGSTEIYKARERSHEIYAIEKRVLEDNVKAHEDNAKGAKGAVDAAAENLKTVRESITDIAEKLNRDYTMKIGIDQASLSSAQQAIADLTKPATKLITIQTQNAAGQATGGLAGQPTGMPWRFAVGGFARKQGKLAGYGGGDKIQALLEPGEFIVRKEAVQKLGVPVLQAVNQGVLPLQRRWGGSIGDAVNEAIKKDKLEAIKQALIAAQSASAYEAIRGRSSLFANRAREKSLSGINLAGLDPETADQVRAAMAKVPEAKQLKANRFTSLDFTGFLNKRNEPIREQSIREGYAFKALLDNLGKVSGRTLGDSGFKIPEAGNFKIPSIPSFPTTEPATLAPPSKTITLQFKAPDGTGQVTAAFNSEADVSKMLDILKQSGARVGA